MRSLHEIDMSMAKVAMDGIMGEIKLALQYDAAPDGAYLSTLWARAQKWTENATQDEGTGI